MKRETEAPATYATTSLDTSITSINDDDAKDTFLSFQLTAKPYPASFDILVKFVENRSTFFNYHSSFSNYKMHPEKLVYKPTTPHLYDLDRNQCC